MRFFISLVFVLFISPGFIFADELSDKKIGNVFNSSIVESSSFKESKLTVKLKVPDGSKGYFVTGDKANKVFAIDSCRLLRNNPDIQHISIWLPMPDGVRVLSASRKTIEEYYGLDFAAMKDNMDLWRESFVLVYDNKESRQRFVDRFVEVR